MKYLLFIATMIFGSQLFSNIAYAAQPTACEVPASLSEEDGVQTLRVFEIKKDSKLSRLQIDQIIETANHMAGQYEEIEITKLSHAIRYLTDASEAGDVLYYVVRYQGEVFTIVLHYPGGNPVGLIFNGGIEAQAKINDSSTDCLR